jgi:hypothetical protein
MVYERSSSKYFSKTSNKRLILVTVKIAPTGAIFLSHALKINNRNWINYGHSKEI